MEYLSINNWEKYQHYSHRNPPWIKLHNKLFDNYEYGRLHDDSKLLLISLYLLASKCENCIPDDITWIKQKTMIQGDVNITPLINAGFINKNNTVPSCNHNDSTTQASCKQNGGTDKSRVETDKKEIYGEFKNVKLTDKELNKLKDRFNSTFEDKIEDLSQYIEKFPRKAKKYSSHYATILSWDRMDKKKNKLKPQRGTLEELYR